ncbi:uncharacterized protein EV154DRAFT_566070 [Mucor mucedo]|uniref:uncharacterized protein n=1 Tax=Mucor mucedo TaxID=29922 RepID=UPI0022204582|nr:uncharacterized protein EV154DRAFT_566070 [Mucor mucedo]KAI7888725.1 hypothetical protein EV154DRAFT_566070 [Mucor mucedo]
MVAIAKVIIAVSAFLRAAQAFCIYNRITAPTKSDEIDGTNHERKIISINVWDARHGPKSFKKTVDGYDSVQCCHWKNQDCNPKGRPNSPISLNVNFSNDDKVTYLYKAQVTCDATSAFIFSGPMENISVECDTGNGEIVKPSLDLLEDRWTEIGHPF